MRLKQAILRVMGRDALKKAVHGLELDAVDRRSVQKMNARLSRARRATPEYLLEPSFGARRQVRMRASRRFRH